MKLSALNPAEDRTWSTATLTETDVLPGEVELSGHGVTGGAEIRVGVHCFQLSVESFLFLLYFSCFIEACSVPVL